MALQFIHDHRGNTTGVFIPIEEWQLLKAKYKFVNLIVSDDPKRLT